MRQKNKVKEQPTNFKRKGAYPEFRPTTADFIPVLSKGLALEIIVASSITALYTWGLFYMENSIGGLLIKVVSMLLIFMFWTDIYWKSRHSDNTGVFLEKNQLRYNVQWGEVIIDWNNITQCSIGSSILRETILILHVVDHKSVFKQTSFIQKLGFYVNKWYNSHYFTLKIKELDITELDLLQLLNHHLESK